MAISLHGALRFFRGIILVRVSSIRSLSNRRSCDHSSLSLLSMVLGSLNHTYIIFAGVFNAAVGILPPGDDASVVGAWGSGRRNIRGSYFQLSAQYFSSP